MAQFQRAQRQHAEHVVSSDRYRTRAGRGLTIQLVLGDGLRDLRRQWQPGTVTDSDSAAAIPFAYSVRDGDSHKDALTYGNQQEGARRIGPDGNCNAQQDAIGDGHGDVNPAIVTLGPRIPVGGKLEESGKQEGLPNGNPSCACPGPGLIRVLAK